MRDKFKELWRNDIALFLTSIILTTLAPLLADQLINLDGPYVEDIKILLFFMAIIYVLSVILLLIFRRLLGSKNQEVSSEYIFLFSVLVGYFFTIIQ
ncbi:hypothetical protein [Aquibacillus kalidii]|uniref:hypothetical protein n=1 Tax=Aquibacillus kalidii TaxID=2762597 RepID=UPI0016497342|nr:hypothetical protein [Aquibacillus kalidii]